MAEVHPSEASPFISSPPNIKKKKAPVASLESIEALLSGAFASGGGGGGTCLKTPSSSPPPHHQGEGGGEVCVGAADSHVTTRVALGYNENTIAIDGSSFRRVGSVVLSAGVTTAVIQQRFYSDKHTDTQASSVNASAAVIHHGDDNTIAHVNHRDNNDNNADQHKSSMLQNDDADEDYEDDDDDDDDAQQQNPRIEGPPIPIPSSSHHHYDDDDHYAAAPIALSDANGKHAVDADAVGQEGSVSNLLPGAVLTAADMDNNNYQNTNGRIDDAAAHSLQDPLVGGATTDAAPTSACVSDDSMKQLLRAHISFEKGHTSECIRAAKAFILKEMSPTPTPTAMGDAKTERPSSCENDSQTATAAGYLQLVAFALFYMLLSYLQANNTRMAREALLLLFKTIEGRDEGAGGGGEGDRGGDTFYTARRGDTHYQQHMDAQRIQQTYNATVGNGRGGGGSGGLSARKKAGSAHSSVPNASGGGGFIEPTTLQREALVAAIYTNSGGERFGHGSSRRSVFEDGQTEDLYNDPDNQPCGRARSGFAFDGDEQYPPIRRAPAGARGSGAEMGTAVSSQRLFPLCRTEAFSRNGVAFVPPPPSSSSPAAASSPVSFPPPSSSSLNEERLFPVLRGPIALSFWRARYEYGVGMWHLLASCGGRGTDCDGASPMSYRSHREEALVRLGNAWRLLSTLEECGACDEGKPVKKACPPSPPSSIIGTASSPAASPSTPLLSSLSILLTIAEVHASFGNIVPCHRLLSSIEAFLAQQEVLHGTVWVMPLWARARRLQASREASHYRISAAQILLREVIGKMEEALFLYDKEVADRKERKNLDALKVELLGPHGYVAGADDDDDDEAEGRAKGDMSGAGEGFETTRLLMRGISDAALEAYAPTCLGGGDGDGSKGGGLRRDLLLALGQCHVQCSLLESCDDERAHYGPTAIGVSFEHFYRGYSLLSQRLPFLHPTLVRAQIQLARLFIKRAVVDGQLIPTDGSYRKGCVLTNLVGGGGGGAGSDSMSAFESVPFLDNDLTGVGESDANSALDYASIGSTFGYFSYGAGEGGGIVNSPTAVPLVVLNPNECGGSSMPAVDHTRLASSNKAEEEAEGKRGESSEEHHTLLAEEGLPDVSSIMVEKPHDGSSHPPTPPPPTVAGPQKANTLPNTAAAAPPHHLSFSECFGRSLAVLDGLLTALTEAVRRGGGDGGGGGDGDKDSQQHLPTVSVLHSLRLEALTTYGDILIAAGESHRAIPCFEEALRAAAAVYGGGGEEAAGAHPPQLQHPTMMALRWKRIAAQIAVIGLAQKGVGGGRSVGRQIPIAAAVEEDLVSLIGECEVLLNENTSASSPSPPPSLLFLSALLHGLGTLYILEGQYTNAVIVHLKTIDLCEQCEEKLERAVVHLNQSRSHHSDTTTSKDAAAQSGGSGGAVAVAAGNDAAVEVLLASTASTLRDVRMVKSHVHAALGDLYSAGLVDLLPHYTTASATMGGGGGGSGWAGSGFMMTVPNNASPNGCLSAAIRHRNVALASAVRAVGERHATLAALRVKVAQSHFTAGRYGDAIACADATIKLLTAALSDRLIYLPAAIPSDLHQKLVRVGMEQHAHRLLRREGGGGGGVGPSRTQQGTDCTFAQPADCMMNNVSSAASSTHSFAALPPQHQYFPKSNASSSSSPAVVPILLDKVRVQEELLNYYLIKHPMYQRASRIRALGIRKMRSKK